MANIIFIVIEIIGPTNNKLAGENAEGDDIGRAFPPIVVGKEKTDSGDNQCGAEVAGFAQAVKGIDYFLL